MSDDNDDITTAIGSIQWSVPSSPKEFLADYWQQKPCLLVNAFPQFQNPLSPDELAGLAMEADIPSRLIRSPREAQWTLSHGPFSEETLTSLPTSDWSILISDVEKHLDGFDAYLQPFRFIPDWRIDDLMISYAPTGASVGAHIDAYDVFLLQAQGQREWRIELEPQSNPTFIPALDLKVLADFKAEATYVLSPGDMLYLPPGVAHHGVSLDNDCMTWSIGFRAPAIADIVHEISQQLTEHLTESDRLGDAGRTLQTHPGEITPATIAAIRSVWNTMMHPDDQTFAVMVGKLLTQFGSDTEPNNAAGAQASVQWHQLAPDDELTRKSSVRLGFIEQTEGCTLFVNTLEFAVSRQLAEFLCDHRSFVYRDVIAICGQTHDAATDNQQCLQTLFDNEWLLVT